MEGIVVTLYNLTTHHRKYTAIYHPTTKGRSGPLWRLNSGNLILIIGNVSKRQLCLIIAFVSDCVHVAVFYLGDLVSSGKWIKRTNKHPSPPTQNKNTKQNKTNEIRIKKYIHT